MDAPADASPPDPLEAFLAWLVAHKGGLFFHRGGYPFDRRGQRPLRLTLMADLGEGIDATRLTECAPVRDGLPLAEQVRALAGRVQARVAAYRREEGGAGTGRKGGHGRGRRRGPFAPPRRQPSK